MISKLLIPLLRIHERKVQMHLKKNHKIKFIFYELRFQEKSFKGVYILLSHEKNDSMLLFIEEFTYYFFR